MISTQIGHHELVLIEVIPLQARAVVQQDIEPTAPVGYANPIRLGVSRKVLEECEFFDLHNLMSPFQPLVFRLLSCHSLENVVEYSPQESSNSGIYTLRQWPHTHGCDGMVDLCEIRVVGSQQSLFIAIEAVQYRCGAQRTERIAAQVVREVVRTAQTAHG